jgi:hypothetical protein
MKLNLVVTIMCEMSDCARTWILVSTRIPLPDPEIIGDLVQQRVCTKYVTRTR